MKKRRRTTASICGEAARSSRQGAPVNRCRAVGSIVTLIASAGCDTTSAPPTPVVRDSAGVRIVENVEPQ